MVKLFPMDLSKPKVNLLMNRGQGSSKVSLMKSVCKL